jgi:hypothetical protein
MLRIPLFLDNWLIDGGKVFSPLKRKRIYGVFKCTPPIKSLRERIYAYNFKLLGQLSLRGLGKPKSSEVECGLV